MLYLRLIYIVVISLFLTVPEVKAFQQFTGKPAHANGYVDLVQKVNPAVVQVVVEGFGGRKSYKNPETSLLSRKVQTGSGVFVDSTGYIVTNAHVVSGARTVQVLLSPMGEYNPDKQSILRPRGNILDAEIIGIDKETDVGLLKVADGDYPHLEFGDSDDLRPGQLVFAFGSPLGLENSVSMGIISSTARQLKPEDPMIYIQTDAPINPGNSGGPLVNTEGELVGINTLNISLTGGSQGLGFAGPSNIVEDIYKQLRKYGRVKRGIIGVYAQTIDPRLADGLGINANYRVILGDVFPGGPADFVGLKPGDIIVSMDGKRMENARQFNVNIYSKPIGEPVELEVYRDGELFNRKVKVIERNDDQARFMEFVDPEKNFIEELGILAIDINREIREMLPPLRRRGGVLVAESNGKAEVLGDPFYPGDVIYFMNGQALDSFSTLKQNIKNLNKPAIVVFQIEREGKLMYISHEFD